MQVGQDVAFPFQLPVVAEVDQVADLLPSDAHVIEELGCVVGSQFAVRFQFDDDPSQTNKSGL